ncbi:MAG: CRTAC1 family protein [Planctomycetota bacterium]|nr:CRTAC1 family protein [Planctomycetota bacterium]
MRTNALALAVGFMALGLMALGFLLGGCPGGCSKQPKTGGSGAASASSAVSEPAIDTSVKVRYTDVTSESGVAFLHRHGGTGEKYFPESMAGGVIVFDYDGDGDVDLYFIQGGKIPVEPDGEWRNVLYRNDGGWRFTDTSTESGLDDPGYGMGGTAGDYDNDGHVDMYITNFGPNRLYRNRGNGTFEDVTGGAGVGDPLWGASAAWGDYDLDGFLDLYVTNYINFTMANHKYCGRKEPGFRAYCHPDEFLGADDVLFRNRGDGTFEDVTRTALPGPIDPGSSLWLSGVQDGKALGVVWTDFDLDGDPDIFVANDSTANFLFVNAGDGTFEFGLTAGVGYNEEGATQACMGVDVGDVNGDGLLDLFSVNLDGETNILYLNGGDGTFTDFTIPTGLAHVSLTFVGFGTNMLDFDNDGDEDIYVANGHILDNIKQYNDAVDNKQTDFLFENDGEGIFRDVSRESGEYFSKKMVGRGSAVADLDDDGDLDLVITNNNQPAVILRNDGGSLRRFIRFRLIGTQSNRDGIGAIVRITAGGRTQIKEVRAGSSYCSQSDIRIHCGLGKTDRAESVVVRWPSGTVENLGGLDAGLLYTVEEGKGIVARMPLPARR